MLGKGAESKLAILDRILNLEEIESWVKMLEKELLGGWGGGIQATHIAVKE